MSVCEKRFLLKTYEPKNHRRTCSTRAHAHRHQQACVCLYDKLVKIGNWQHSMQRYVWQRLETCKRHIFAMTLCSIFHNSQLFSGNDYNCLLSFTHTHTYAHIHVYVCMQHTPSFAAFDLKLALRCAITIAAAKK